MKNRYGLLLFIGFILGLTIIAVRGVGLGANKISVEESLIKSIESTQAQIMESTISAWGKVNDRFMTEQEIAAEMNFIVDLVKPEKSTLNIVKQNSEEINKQTLYGSVGSKYYTIAVESLKTEKGGETYVVIDASIDNNSTELIAERQKLEKYFEAEGVKYKVSSCIIGVYDGKLTETDMRSKIANAMDSVKAKEVEGLSNEEVNSISAFSGNINSFVLSNNKKVNMQIAMRYSSYDDKTYIWIGSPLIHVEY